MPYGCHGRDASVGAPHGRDGTGSQLAFGHGRMAESAASPCYESPVG